jgi:hypothetical protein
VVLIRASAGLQRHRFWLRRPAGVVLLTRIVVPVGTAASVSAEIPGFASVGVDTHDFASNTCRTSAQVLICTRSQEWCPMPAARWRVTLEKRGGPAGVIRFVFLVGAPQAT